MPIARVYCCSLKSKFEKNGVLRNVNYQNPQNWSFKKSKFSTRISGMVDSHRKWPVALIDTLEGFFTWTDLVCWFSERTWLWN